MTSPLLQLLLQLLLNLHSSLLSSLSSPSPTSLVLIVEAIRHYFPFLSLLLPLLLALPLLLLPLLQLGVSYAIKYYIHIKYIQGGAFKGLQAIISESMRQIKNMFRQKLCNVEENIKPWVTWSGQVFKFFK